LETVPELATPAHIRAMTTVLNEYHAKYELRDGRLYISERLSRDKELLANYTNKAIGETPP
jgi:hypothetical protein